MNYDDFDIKSTKETIRSAGLTVEEVIVMLPITKQTYYNWMKGNPVRDYLRFRLTAVRFTLLAAAVSKGLLPLPEHTPKEQRAELITQAMQQAKR